jgi:hypothetical protein
MESLEENDEERRIWEERLVPGVSGDQGGTGGEA